MRFNPATREFGVLTPNLVIRTFFKRPALCTAAENLDYFNNC